MNTLSEQLTELYKRKWGGLIEQLKANGLRGQLQCPFLISALRIADIEKKREENKLDVEENPENEAWYTDAGGCVKMYVNMHFDALSSFL